MAQDSKKLARLFFGDGSKALEFFRVHLREIEKGRLPVGFVEEAFRHAHSVKSEASFLGHEEAAEASNAVEEILNRVRKGGSAAGLSQAVRDLQTSLSKIVRSAASGAGFPAEPDAFGLSDFERILIRESHRLGERFYVATIAVDSGEPMPYPRLYLVVNNLEMHTHVIKVEPALVTLEKGRDTRATVLVAASAAAEEIYRATVVDRLAEYSLVPVPVESLLPGDSRIAVESEEERQSIKVSDESSPTIAVDRLVLREAEFLLSMEPSAAPHARRILVDSLRSGVGNLVNRLETLAKDLSARLGKNAVFLFRGDIRLRMRQETLGHVIDLLVQLVRNAFDHGIETVDERLARGKKAVGFIQLAIEKKGPEWILVLEDDGRGVDRTEVVRAAQERGMSVKDSDSLLAVLSHPGFSTRSRTTAVSGRGVGLDIAVYTATERLGGRLELTSTAGHGSVFSLRFSEEDFKHRVFPVLIGNMRIPIPDFLIREYMPWNPERFIKKNSGGSYGVRGVYYPIPQGFVPAAETARKAVVVQRSGGTFVLPADEILKDDYLDPAVLASGPLSSLLG